MATLTSMRLTAAELKKRGEEVPISDKAPREKYPWGLELDLNDESLGKLGIDVSDLSVGQTVAVVGKAKVRSARISESEDGTDMSASIQITHLSLTPVATEKKTLRQLVGAIG